MDTKEVAVKQQPLLFYKRSVFK